MQPLQRLWEAAAPEPGSSSREASRGSGLPAELASLYDGDLTIDLHRDRPTVVANFVSTLDGVVALDDAGATGTARISGSAEADRFVMALLRAMADAVVVGAGTVRAAARHEWTPRGIHAVGAPACAAWRASLGLAAPQPRTVVVTAAGHLDPLHRGLTAPDVPVTLLTTRAGAARLSRMSFAPGVQVVEATAGDRVGGEAFLDALRAAGVRLALCEGGPHLIADLLAAGILDELFLTLAPQLAGRDDQTRRLALVEGLALPAGGGRWAELRSVRRAGDLLFLRYRFRPLPQVS